MAEVVRIPSAWPEECLESEERFGHYLARFYPLLPYEVRTRWGKSRRNGAMVRTPKGMGRLADAKAGEVGVVFEGKEKMVHFDMRDVEPA